MQCCVATQLLPQLWSICDSCGWYDMHLRMVGSVALHDGGNGIPKA